MTSQTVFGHSQALLDMRDRLRDFVDREAIPREHAELAHDVEKLDHVARLLREKAKAAGLYAPQLPTSHGGLGLSWKERAVILEEAGRSFLGPLAINCAPPDQPNMINLMLHGTAEQRSGTGTQESPTVPEHPSRLLAPHLLSILDTVYLLRVSGDDRPCSSYSSESALLSVSHSVVSDSL